MSRPNLVQNIAGPAGRSSLSAASIISAKNGGSVVRPEMEKPIASGNGVSVSIILAEPTIYLTGLDHDGTTRDSATNGAGILRGKLQLSVTKTAKIKTITLKFTGRARTEWPEGKQGSLAKLGVCISHSTRDPPRKDTKFRRRFSQE
jgi:hypothetical protein